MDWSDFVNVEMTGLAASVFVLIWVVRRIATRFKAGWLTMVNKLCWKVAPAFPIGMALCGTLFGPNFGLFEGDSVGLRIIKGLLAGFVAIWGRQLVKRLFLDKLGIDISKPGLTGPPPPTPKG